MADSRLINTNIDLHEHQFNCTEAKDPTLTRKLFNKVILDSKLKSEKSILKLIYMIHPGNNLKVNTDPGNRTIPGSSGQETDSASTKMRHFQKSTCGCNVGKEAFSQQC